MVKKFKVKLKQTLLIITSQIMFLRLENFKDYSHLNDRHIIFI